MHRSRSHLENSAHRSFPANSWWLADHAHRPPRDGPVDDRLLGQVIRKARSGCGLNISSYGYFPRSPALWDNEDIQISPHLALGNPHGPKATPFRRWRVAGSTVRKYDIGLLELSTAPYHSLPKDRIDDRGQTQIKPLQTILRSGG